MYNDNISIRNEEVYMCKDKNNRQALSEIIKEYSIRLDEKYNTDYYTTDIFFYKKKVKKLRKILSEFDINMRCFLSKEKGKERYFFNDSQEEIITMLERFDNGIVKNIRNKKNIDYKSLLFDEGIADTITGAVEFAEALKSFMNKNGYNLPKEISDYETEEEFCEDLYENVEKIAIYDSNNAKFNSHNETRIEISKIALECSRILVEMIEYTKSTDTFWAVNEQFALDMLKVFKEDMQTCLNKYKIHFDCLFNGAYESYPDYEYKPFPTVEYNPKKEE